jgi:hypothetical protein
MISWQELRVYIVFYLVVTGVVVLAEAMLEWWM